MSAVTPTDWRGKSGSQVVPSVGSFIPLIPFKAVPPNDTSMTVTFPQLSVIHGAVLMPLDSGNNTVFGDSDGAIGPDVTWSGNVLTIADGTDFDLSGHTSGAIYGIVWGEAKL